MNYWSVTSSKRSSLQLWKNSDGYYQVMKYDFMGLILEGYDVLLIKEELVPFIQSLPEDEITIEKTKIIRKATNESWENYYELDVKYSINTENSDTLLKQIVKFQNEYLFVSTAFKEKLEAHFGSYLSFSKGWTGFG